MSSARRLDAQDLRLEIVEFVFLSKILILFHKPARKLLNNATREGTSIPWPVVCFQSLAMLARGRKSHIGPFPDKTKA